uniref:FTH domain-containing protein n=1 Tax=Parastrongyloides trichosuri TaxID=131310 RepID=A0A0N4Z2T8_PARTI
MITRVCSKELYFIIDDERNRLIQRPMAQKIYYHHGFENNEEKKEFIITTNQQINYKQGRKSIEMTFIKKKFNEIRFYLEYFQLQTAHSMFCNFEGNQSLFYFCENFLSVYPLNLNLVVLKLKNINSTFLIFDFLDEISQTVESLILDTVENVSVQHNAIIPFFPQLKCFGIRRNVMGSRFENKMIRNVILDSPQLEYLSIRNSTSLNYLQLLDLIVENRFQFCSDPCMNRNLTTYLYIDEVTGDDEFDEYIDFLEFYLSPHFDTVSRSIQLPDFRTIDFVFHCNRCGFSKLLFLYIITDLDLFEKGHGRFITIR